MHQCLFSVIFCLVSSFLHYFNIHLFYLFLIDIIFSFSIFFSVLFPFFFLNILFSLSLLFTLFGLFCLLFSLFFRFLMVSCLFSLIFFNPFLQVSIVVKRTFHPHSLSSVPSVRIIIRKNNG